MTVTVMVCSGADEWDLGIGQWLGLLLNRSETSQWCFVEDHQTAGAVSPLPGEKEGRLREP